MPHHYPTTRSIQVKSKPVNTKVNTQMQRPPPRTTQPVVTKLPYHASFMAKKRYKK